MVLLDQLCAIVDGGPVQQSDVLFVRQRDIVSGFHQLLAALQDAEPETHGKHFMKQPQVDITLYDPHKQTGPVAEHSFFF